MVDSRRRRMLPALALTSACPTWPVWAAGPSAPVAATPTPTALTAPTAAAMPAAPTADDPYLWLEDVQGERALAWVRQRNAQTRATLEASPRFQPIREQVRAILDSREKIPYVGRHGAWLYNHWRDAQHPRGLWRRTTLESYRRAQPEWQLLLDLDALAKAEGENWVWAGTTTRTLKDGRTRALVSLSRGGADATVLREFDLDERRFVDGGFTLPEAKSQVAWDSDDTVFVGTDFGPGSLTDSGYPRLVKRWRRGQPLAQAALVFEGQVQDVSASAEVDRTPGHETTLLSRALDFYRQETYLLTDAATPDAAPRLQRVPIPEDAGIDTWYGRALVRLRSDWAVAGRVWPAGSLLVCDLASLMAGQPRLQALFTPTPTRALAGWATTRHHVLVNVLDNVAGKLEEWRQVNGKDGQDGTWQGRPVAAPFPGTLGVSGLHDPQVANDPLAEHYWLTYADFVTPDSLLLGRTGSDRHETLKSLPAFFDTRGVRVEQRSATSPDGTAVPYFIVWPAGAKADGDNPTLLYGYGGFNVSQKPRYSPGFGSAWVARGGVLVIANIRGGGEFGPAWHQAAVKAHKQKSYDDFIAVARDLVAQQVSQPKRLGIMGGSNGGLLVGAVMLQAPELLGAVVCQVPLLDMRRYHRLLAGASWMAEYGDPDKPAEWAWISKYSPYQNLKPRADQALPAVLFTTSTRDDRVHPGHARKMAAKMLAGGHTPLYYENIEGGHGGAADNAQRADMLALEFSFLWERLGG